MRVTRSLTVLIVLGLAASAAIACSAHDRAGVERAVLDYVEGLYELKPELIERSVHPELVKFGFARRSPDDDWRVIPMSYERLHEIAGTYYKEAGGPPPGAPKTVEVLDVLNQTAAAKLTADWGVDYFHLAKYDGRWKIVHVLWQSLDDD